MEIRHLKFEQLLQERGFNGVVEIIKKRKGRFSFIRMKQKDWGVQFLQGRVRFTVSFADLEKYSDKQLVSLADDYQRAWQTDKEPPTVFTSES